MSCDFCNDWLSSKELAAMQETQVGSLGQGDPLEEGMATHSSILAWRIPWTEKPGGLQSMHGVSRELDITQGLNNNKKIMQLVTEKVNMN